MASSEPVFLREVLPLIRAELDAGRCVRIHPKGVSMEPMLKGGRDSVLLAPLTLPVRKYDVVLYQRPNGQFVLHRVIGLHDGLCDFCGDNQFAVEKNVPQDCLIAVVSSFQRDGRETDCEEVPYGIYCRLWCWSRPLRRQMVRVRHLAGSIRRKIRKTE